MAMVWAGCHWSRYEGLSPREILFSKYWMVGGSSRRNPLPSVPCAFPGAIPSIPLSIFTWVPAWLFPFKVLFPPVSFGTNPYVGNERGCFSTDEENDFKCFSSNRLGSVEIDVMK